MISKYSEKAFNEGYAVIKKYSEAMFDQQDIEVEEYDNIIMQEVGFLFKNSKDCKDFINLSTSYMIINLVEP